MNCYTYRSLIFYVHQIVIRYSCYIVLELCLNFVVFVLFLN